jgi:membrane protein
MMTLSHQILEGLRLLRLAAARWSEDNAMRMGAALSFYATFSLAPVLILAISIAGLLFGRQAAEGQLVNELSRLIGTKSAMTVQNIIQASWKPAHGLVASIMSIATLVFGATGVLVELKQALNRIWRSHASSSLRSIVQDRVRSLGLILGVGFLLVISLMLSALISAMEKMFGSQLQFTGLLWEIVNITIPFGVITGLFAMIFKWLPDTPVDWHDVWTGAAVTAFLFTVGKQLFGFYLGRSSVSSAYGAAGSIVIILLWVYYSALILYYGAEFTVLYAKIYGSRKT